MHSLSTYIITSLNKADVCEGVKSAERRYLDTNKVDPATFYDMVKQDPTPQKKYIEWLLGEYVNANYMKSHFEDARELLVKFEELTKKGLIQNKDIYTYTFDKLKTAVEDAEKLTTKSELKRLHKKDIRVVQDDAEYLIIVPLTKEAAIYYGKGTRWCTSARTHNAFDQYADRGYVLYYIIPKDDSGKYAVTVSEGRGITVYNSNDDQIDDNNLIIMGIDLSLFKPLTADEQIKKIEAKLAKNSDGSYSTNGSIDLIDLNLTEIPFRLKEVLGDFICSHNSIATFKGVFTEDSRVGGRFLCEYNKLTSLEGIPDYIGGDFLCIHNELESLEGCPEVIYRDFWCSSNKFTSLKGSPKTVGRSFSCGDSLSLVSLEGGPDQVGWNYYCENASLTSLHGAPTNELARGFHCANNNIASLVGAPQIIGEDFNCVRNNLRTLEGGPIIVKRDYN